MLTPLFALPSPFEIELGTVKLLEPPWSDATALTAQLLKGVYPKPFLIEHEGLLSLYFGPESGAKHDADQ